MFGSRPRSRAGAGDGTGLGEDGIGSCAGRGEAGFLGVSCPCRECGSERGGRGVVVVVVLVAGSHGFVGCFGAGDLEGLDDEEHGYPDELEGGPDNEEDGEGIFKQLPAKVSVENVALVGLGWSWERKNIDEGEADEDEDANHHEYCIQEEVTVIIYGDTVVDPRTMAVEKLVEA